jgi:hypothetical protein
MNRTPLPISVAVARNLPWKPGRSAEAFIDGDLEVRFTPGPSRGLQTPHERDELYFVAAGSGRYRVGDEVTAVGTGDLLFAARIWLTASRSSATTSRSGLFSTDQSSRKPSDFRELAKPWRNSTRLR